MKHVGIAYAFHDEKLAMPPVIWPQRCPCCGIDQVDAQYNLKHKARATQSRQGTSTVSTYYELDWDVPYCSACVSHAKPIDGLAAVIGFFGLILIIVFALAASDDFLPMVGAIAGTALLGLVAYQVVLRAVIHPRMTDDCVWHSYALFARSDYQKVYFHFRNNDYGAWFAAINDVPLEDGEWKPAE